jgi:hypothetical protein
MARKRGSLPGLFGNPFSPFAVNGSTILLDSRVKRGSILILPMTPFIWLRHKVEISSRKEMERHPERAAATQTVPLRKKLRTKGSTSSPTGGA